MRAHTTVATVFVFVGCAGACGARASLDVDEYVTREVADAGSFDARVSDAPTVDADDGDASPRVDADAGPTRECPGDATDPVVLANEAFISDVVVDHDNVYWSTLAGAIKKTPRCGGAVTELVEHGAWGRNRMALSSKDVYWARGDDIGRISKNGGHSARFARSFGWNLVADDTSLYVFADDGLSRFPLDGGDPTVVSPVSPMPYPGSTRGNNLAITGNDVYVARDLFPSWTGGVDIIDVAKVGDSGETLYSDKTIYMVSAITADGSYVYYAGALAANYGQAWVLSRAPLSGGSQESVATLVANSNVSSGWVDELTVDDTYVYWVGLADGRTTLQRVSKTDGTAEELLYDNAAADESLLAMDDVYLYVVFGGETLERVKK